VIFTPVSRVASAERRRNPFTVDDGTGTVECTFRLDQDPHGDRANVKQGTLFQAPSKNRSSALIPVGSVVRVQGRVRAKWNSREICGESIGPSTPTLVLERTILTTRAQSDAMAPGLSLTIGDKLSLCTKSTTSCPRNSLFRLHPALSLLVPKTSHVPPNLWSPMPTLPPLHLAFILHHLRQLR
jgi:hypothetical protein